MPVIFLISYFFSFVFGENFFDAYKSVKDKETFPFYSQKYEYNIYWGFLNVGKAVIKVEDVVEISTKTYAYKIVSNAVSSSFIDNLFKVRDKNIGYLDVNFERSYGYYKDINEGKYSLKEYTVFDYEKKKFYGKKTKNGKEKEHYGELEQNVYDILSSLYLFVKSEKEPEKVKKIDIVTTKLWKLEVTNHGMEKIKINSKKIKCYKLEPKVGDDGIFISKKGRSLYVYLSEDKKVPVMLEAEVFIGSVVAKLEDYDKQK
ncbi:MAG: DUF3108 domain-containing protein [Elusimicrobiota bacterium]